MNEYTLRWKHKISGETYGPTVVKADSEEEAKEKITRDYPPEYKNQIEFI